MPRPEKILFGAPWFALVGLLLFPVVWSVSSWADRTFFPVWRNVTIESYEVTPSGLQVYVQFDKVRECELVDIYWYAGSVRAGVTRDLEVYRSARTEGTHRVGPWTLYGVTSLEGTHATALHDCYSGNLWRTVSHLYP